MRGLFFDALPMATPISIATSTITNITMAKSIFFNSGGLNQVNFYFISGYKCIINFDKKKGTSYIREEAP